MKFEQHNKVKSGKSKKKIPLKERYEKCWNREFVLTTNIL